MNKSAPSPQKSFLASNVGYFYLVDAHSAIVQVQAGLLVCDVFSGWAGPCHIMKPIITKLKAKVTFIC